MLLVSLNTEVITFAEIGFEKFNQRWHGSSLSISRAEGISESGWAI